MYFCPLSIITAHPYQALGSFWRYWMCLPHTGVSRWCTQVPPSPTREEGGSGIGAPGHWGHLLMRAWTAGGLWKMLEVLGWDPGYPWDIVTPDTHLLAFVLCSVTCEEGVHLQWYKPAYSNSKCNIRRQEYSTNPPNDCSTLTGCTGSSALATVCLSVFECYVLYCPLLSTAMVRIREERIAKGLVALFQIHFLLQRLFSNIICDGLVRKLQLLHRKSFL